MNFPMLKIAEACTELGLRQSIMILRQLAEKAKRNETLNMDALSLAIPEFFDDLRILHRIIGNELDSVKFMYVRPELECLHDAVDLFGQDVGQRFGKASFHIQEAGNCLSLERSTAAVYHLMCVLDIGLDSLAFALNIPYSQKNWQPILQDIHASVAAISQVTNGPNWKSDKAYYGKVALEFGFFKDAWRNHTAHGRAKFTEPEAISVFEHVKSFMQQLAQHLQERP